MTSKYHKNSFFSFVLNNQEYSLPNVIINKMHIFDGRFDCDGQCNIQYDVKNNIVELVFDSFFSDKFENYNYNSSWLDIVEIFKFMKYMSTDLAHIKIIIKNILHTFNDKKDNVENLLELCNLISYDDDLFEIYKLGVNNNYINDIRIKLNLVKKLEKFPVSFKYDLLFDYIRSYCTYHVHKCNMYYLITQIYGDFAKIYQYIGVDVIRIYSHDNKYTRLVVHEKEIIEYVPYKENQTYEFGILRAAISHIVNLNLDTYPS